ncbi:MAG: cell division transport system permease protein [Actinomycetota bacterium]|jgi:cell division transport system permease protein
MSRLRLLVSEAWSSITANISTTFASTMTVLIAMFLLGLFIALGTWVLSYSDHVKRELVVKVYFRQQATQAQEYAVGRRLRRDGRLASVAFVSKAQAQAIMKKKLPVLYKTALPSNPLPDSWVAKPKVAADAPKIGREIQKAVRGGDAAASAWPGVNDVKWGDKTTNRVLTVAKVLSLVFLVAIILLVTASTLLIANTIRLSIFARRREIEVMKLVGATNWFVRGPFMLEGLLQGVIGSVCAVILLVVGKTIALPAILGHLHSTSDVHALPFVLNALALVAAGLLLGAAGSGLTMRRFLQV